MIIKNQKIPIHMIPKFQQGAWVNNLYTNPKSDVNQALNLMATPNATGYEQQLQNTQLNMQLDANRRANVQQGMQQTNMILQQRQQQFANQMAQEQMEQRKLEFETNQNLKLIGLQDKYTDKILGMNILAHDQEKFNEILESKGAGEQPSDLQGYGEYSKALNKALLDPEMRKLTEKAALQGELKKQLESATSIMKKLKTDPAGAGRYYDLKKLNENYASIVNRIANFNDADDYGTLSQELNNFATEFSETGQQAIELENRKQELANQKAEMLVEKQAIINEANREYYKFIEDNPNATDQEIARAATIATQKVNKYSFGIGQGTNQDPLNEGETKGQAIRNRTQFYIDKGLNESDAEIQALKDVYDAIKGAKYQAKNPISSRGGTKMDDGSWDYGTYGMNKDGITPTYGTFGDISSLGSKVTTADLKAKKSENDAFIGTDLVTRNGKVYLRVPKANNSKVESWLQNVTGASGRKVRHVVKNAGGELDDVYGYIPTEEMAGIAPQADPNSSPTTTPNQTTAFTNDAKQYSQADLGIPAKSDRPQNRPDLANYTGNFGNIKGDKNIYPTASDIDHGNNTGNEAHRLFLHPDGSVDYEAGWAAFNYDITAKLTGNSAHTTPKSSLLQMYTKYVSDGVQTVNSKKIVASLNQQGIKDISIHSTMEELMSKGVTPDKLSKAILTIEAPGMIPYIPTDQVVNIGGHNFNAQFNPTTGTYIITHPKSGNKKEISSYKLRLLKQNNGSE